MIASFAIGTTLIAVVMVFIFVMFAVALIRFAVHRNAEEIAKWLFRTMLWIGFTTPPCALSAWLWRKALG
jgi:hypothetical protein